MKNQLLTLCGAVAIVATIGTSYRTSEPTPPPPVVISVTNETSCAWGVSVSYAKTCAGGATTLAIAPIGAYSTWTYTLPNNFILKELKYFQLCPPPVGYTNVLTWNCNPGGTVQGTSACCTPGSPQAKLIFIGSTKTGTIANN